MHQLTGTDWRSGRRTATTIVWLLLVVFLAACGGTAEPTTDAANTQIALGEQVYQASCAECHGANLEGEADWKLPAADGGFRAPPHDETGHTWHHGDAYLIESIRLGGTRLTPEIGISNMPAYDTVLTEAEIAAVLAYIKSTWPPDIRAAQEARQ